MAEQPTASVMITVFNGAPYLAEAIESILAQTYPAIEVVVVDDGSTDVSGDIARSYGSPVTVVAHARVGMGASRNRALEVATGAHLAFLDADDRMRRHAVETLSRTLADDPDLDAVFAHVHEFVSDDLSSEEKARLRPPAQRIAGRLPTTMLARRDAFDRVGPFPTHLKRGIGLDWAARAIEAGLHTRVLDDVLFERRLHRSNNGLREQDSSTHYAQVIKSALDRRRALGKELPG